MPASNADRLRWYHTQANVDASEAYVDKLVAEAPPLTAGQKARLRVLLQRRPGAPEASPTPAPAAPAAEAPLLAQEEKARLRVPLRRAGPPETTPASTPTTQAAA